jgi:hypothetical protein
LKRKSILAALAIFMMVRCASAQVGRIALTGTNPVAVSVTNTTDAAVSTTVALGTLTPAIGESLTSGVMQLKLRSNKAYVLSAQASIINFDNLGASDGGTTLTGADIGFGVTALMQTGANVANSGSRTDSIVPKFNYMAGFPAPTNGLTPFTAAANGTLADLSALTPILSGPRISSRGNMSTDNNYIVATVGIATLPQYFTPNTNFSVTITLSITAP